MIETACSVAELDNARCTHADGGGKSGVGFRKSERHLAGDNFAELCHGPRHIAHRERHLHRILQGEVRSVHRRAADTGT